MKWLIQAEDNCLKYNHPVTYDKVSDKRVRRQNPSVASTAAKTKSLWPRQKSQPHIVDRKHLRRSPVLAILAAHATKGR